MVDLNPSQLFSRSALMAITMAALVSTPQHALAVDGDTRPATIQVTGSGTVSIAPDIAIISMGVVRQARTAREALDANNKAMADVIAALKEKSITDKDLQTSNFNIQPRLQYFQPSSNGDQKPPKIIGYQVSNQLTIRIRDLKLVGPVLDMAVTLGINDGGNIQFTNDNPSEALTGARTKAMENAIKKATTLVNAAGVKLGRVLNISEQSNNSRPVPLARARAYARSAEASVPVQGGENSYSVNVTVSWDIEQ